jgi:Na+-translocating ferredoxin:NAD+ oxidoreductase RNF subunit RnfB
MKVSTLPGQALVAVGNMPLYMCWQCALSGGCDYANADTKNREKVKDCCSGVYRVYNHSKVVSLLNKAINSSMNGFSYLEYIDEALEILRGEKK